MILCFHIYPSSRPYKISIDERCLDVCASIFQRSKKPRTYTEFHSRTHIHSADCVNENVSENHPQFAVWTSRWKKEIIKYSKHTAAVVAPMVAAIVLAFMLCTTSHSPFTHCCRCHSHFVLMACIWSEQRSRFRPTINWNEADHLHAIVNHLLFAANAFWHRSGNDPHHQLIFAYTNMVKLQAWKMISIVVEKLKNLEIFSHLLKRYNSIHELISWAICSAIFRWKLKLWLIS